MAKKWTKAQQRAHRRKWVKALRSGKYEQGRGLLKDSQGAFCCLGVACDISGLGEWYAGNYYKTESGTSLKDLPNDVREWLGLRGSYGTYGSNSLVNRNDTPSRGHLTFKGIASLIEREPKGLVEE